MLEAPLAWSDLTYILYKRVTQTYTLQTDNRTKDENLMELKIRAAIKVTYIFASVYMRFMPNPFRILTLKTSAHK